MKKLVYRFLTWYLKPDSEEGTDMVFKLNRLYELYLKLVCYPIILTLLLTVLSIWLVQLEIKQ